MTNRPSAFARTKKPLNAEMNVVPYIDVMLVLLVIFMVTAPMLATGVDVSLPKEDTKTVSQNELPVIVSLKADGSVFVSHKNAIDEPMDDAQLDALLRNLYSENENLQVMVNADADNPYHQIMHIMALIQNAGVSQVSLLSEAAK
ncbi:protein TolR [Moraxella pluranimalium]|uniref:Tol-Pal system protein TolR n=1 Tax=Moraxella pluranimalium TaxID=470453 RepID=A0A1T0CSK9_9GAMM|nr:protein TolR [Moraxella pluranimalium]OOS25151.1 protein TolR [Moraxella pluranimalium]